MDRLLESVKQRVIVLYKISHSQAPEVVKQHGVRLGHLVTGGASQHCGRAWVVWIEPELELQRRGRGIKTGCERGERGWARLLLRRVVVKAASLLLLRLHLLLLLLDLRVYAPQAHQVAGGPCRVAVESSVAQCPQPPDGLHSPPNVVLAACGQASDEKFK